MVINIHIIIFNVYAILLSYRFNFVRWCQPAGMRTVWRGIKFRTNENASLLTDKPVKVGKIMIQVNLTLLVSAPLMLTYVLISPFYKKLNS